MRSLRRAVSGRFATLRRRHHVGDRIDSPGGQQKSERRIEASVAQPTNVQRHLVSIKAFSRWLFVEKRTPDDLLIGLRSFNEETDRRHVRREFTIEELTYLLESIHNRTLPEHRISGPDRAIACRLALGTGLRAGELRSLTTASFDFKSETPTVSVAAAYSKRRRDDVLLLQGDLADLLKTWMEGKPESVKIFKHLPQNTARMLRSDLKAARAEWISEAPNDQERAKRANSDFLRYRNAAGEVIDFHATRHCFISNIVAGGASVKTAQVLARHSTSRLTVDRYAHARFHDLQGAVDSLPGYEQPPGVQPENEALRATGTDGTKTYESKGAQHLAQQTGEIVLFGAKPGEKKAGRSAENESPDGSQVEAPCDVMPASAITDDKRRRWESNPRWRICNPLP